MPQLLRQIRRQQHKLLGDAKKLLQLLLYRSCSPTMPYNQLSRVIISESHYRRLAFAKK
jgi:hypothetical protein